MEYITFNNSRGLNLSGRFYPAGSDGIIIMCHGLTADKSSLGRFDILAESFRLSGFNVLNFDFSGCGESDDDVISVKGDYFTYTPLLWKLRREIDDRIEPILFETGNDKSGFLQSIVKEGIEIRA
jgi:alpha-beta hydrolase superfamily lysophospholipase